jgi:5-methylcytosine-specific restriction endonuclease McrA
MKVNFKKSKGVFSEFQKPLQYKRRPKIKSDKTPRPYYNGRVKSVLLSSIKIKAASYYATKETYKEYLLTDWWREKRKLKLKQVGSKCQRCGSKKKLNVHHLRYNDRNNHSVLFRERMRDLEVLCEICHQKEHGFIQDSTLTPLFYIDTVNPHTIYSSQEIPMSREMIHEYIDFLFDNP